MRKKCSLVMVVCVVSLAMVAKALGENEQESVEFTKDITYAHVDDIALKLDMARPVGSAKSAGRRNEEGFPALIYVHGGGWKEGHRSAYRGEIQRAARRGYVAVTVTHRLTATVGEDGRVKHPWPACIHDCKAAVRYLRANAKRYGIDPDRLGMTGASSGGHLSLMVALTNDEDGLEGEVTHVVETGGEVGLVSSRIQAAVNISGPAEMVTCHLSSIVTPYAESLLGGPPATNAQGYVEASPIHYVTRDDPPVMTLHGGLDKVVPVEQAYLLAEKMKQVYEEKDVHELVIYEDQPHVFRGETAQRSWEALYGFFDRVLKKR